MTDALSSIPGVQVGSGAARRRTAIPPGADRSALAGASGRLANAILPGQRALFAPQAADPSELPMDPGHE